MTPYQSNLFFIAEYVLSAVMIVFLTWKKTSFDARKIISRKTFARRLPFVLISVLLPIVLMTVIIIFSGLLGNTASKILIGALQFLLTLLANVLLGASWLQRYRVYPRGSELCIVVMLLYIISDLFMPAGIKYAILLGGTVLGFIFPDTWDDWKK
ncbi:hypothetical protein [Dialister sp.]|uniref:hypothetical protein n=1 Tax=Dialister sp. TaxID=1955814 RepID=UPI002E805499|nr:hypothetical protein [Dialister sp.]MEE3453444.1 hypothetical protein [Dialister sp.]